MSPRVPAMFSILLTGASHSLEPSILAFLLTIFVCHIRGDACGGLFESNAGEFDLPLNYNGDGDLECVWIVQLLSRRNVSFTLNSLDSSTATVSLYPEHEASETVLNPIRLSSSDVNQPIQTTGQTLIVVLTRSDYSAGLSFTWKSVAAPTDDVISAVNYVDSGEGRVLWNQFGQRERLTWVLNLPSQNSLTLKAETEFGRCDLVNACWCSYFGIYEIMNTGYLREVTRTCGRSLSLEIEQLYSKLVAFVYINSTVSVTETEHVELTWATRESVVTEDPWLPSDGTTEAPVGCANGNYSYCVSLDCGGLISMPNFPSPGSFAVEYKPTDESKTRNHCMWTFDNVANNVQYEVQVKITLLSNEFVYSGGALSVVNWKYNESSYVLSQVELLYRNDSYQTEVRKDRKLFFAYSSNNAHNSGFLILVDIIQTSTLWEGSNYVYKSKSGEESYGPFSSPDFVAIVINPREENITFTLDYLSYGDYKSGFCDLDDTFNISEISPKTGPKLLKRSCIDEASPLSYTSQYPILATFVAFDYTQTRFKISWT